MGFGWIFERVGVLKNDNCRFLRPTDPIIGGLGDGGVYFMARGFRGVVFGP